MNKIHSFNLRSLVLIIILTAFSGYGCSIFRATEPRQVRSAKKQQEKKQAKMKKDYQLFVKNSRKRSYEIQSDDVKARMKKNEANISARDKERARRTKSQSKNRAKRFR